MFVKTFSLLLNSCFYSFYFKQFSLLHKGGYFGFLLLGSTLLQVHLIVDAILHRRTAIRMEVSFFSLLNDARCFWDSAKEKKVWRFFPIAFLFLIMPIFTCWTCWKDLQKIHFQSDWLLMGLFLGIIGTLGHFFLPKKLSYATDQIVFQHTLCYVRKLFRFS